MNLYIKIFSLVFLGLGALTQAPEIHNVINVYFTIITVLIFISFLAVFTQEGQKVFANKAAKKNKFLSQLDFLIDVIVVFGLAFLGYNFFAVAYGVVSITFFINIFSKY